MTSTQIRRWIRAPRAQIYEALVDPSSVARWRFPAGMTCHLHQFDARQGGRLRISLTYEDEGRAGKTEGRTDTYHGRFVRLVPNELVVEVDQFETEDPAFRGAMTITIRLVEKDGGTEVSALHEGVPDGIEPAANDEGWHQTLTRLAALVERDD